MTNSLSSILSALVVYWRSGLFMVVCLFLVLVKVDPSDVFSEWRSLEYGERGVPEWPPGPVIGSSLLTEVTLVHLNDEKHPRHLILNNIGESVRRDYGDMQSV